MQTFAEYEEAALALAVYPGRHTTFGLDYVAHKMAGEAGEFAEHFGKMLRDDGIVEDIEDQGSGYVSVLVGPVPADRRDLLKKEIGDVLWYLAAAADELGTSLGELAAGNITKLTDRKNRGVLGGSGDNR